MALVAQVTMNPRTPIRAATRLVRRPNQHPQLTVAAGMRRVWSSLPRVVKPIPRSVVSIFSSRFIAGSATRPAPDRAWPPESRPSPQQSTRTLRLVLREEGRGFFCRISRSVRSSRFSLTDQGAVAEAFRTPPGAPCLHDHQQPLGNIEAPLDQGPEERGQHLLVSVSVSTPRNRLSPVIVMRRPVAERRLCQIPGPLSHGTRPTLFPRRPPRRLAQAAPLRP